MQEKLINVRFDVAVRIGRRETAGFLALLIFCALPLELGADSLNLTTWYPAPYGVYSQLRSTGNSYFAYQGGNVGIGTTNPGAMLSLGSAIANTKLAVYDDGTNFYGLGVQAGQFRFHIDQAVNRFSFLDAPAGNEIVTIKGSGNVGIGTTSPQSKLDVNGDVKIGNSGASCSSANVGAVRYNSSNSAVEYCDGGSWNAIGGGVGNLKYFCHQDGVLYFGGWSPVDIGRRYVCMAGGCWWFVCNAVTIN